MANTKLYGVWQGMKGRCYYPSNRWFKNYGGKGIQVCEEWLNDSSAFINWALDSGYKEGLTIERIDRSGNYEPSNCRWVTRFEQTVNRDQTLFITAFGLTKSVQEWAIDPRCVCKRETLGDRIKKGWNPEQAISTPRFKKPALLGS